MRKAKGFTPLESKIPARESGRFLTGFTLIELLVVISVIVLLMAILLPVLQRVRNQARAAVCQSNLKQWGTTLALYIEDSQGYLPFPGGYFSILRGMSFSNDDPNGPEPLNPVDTKGILLCPMAIRSGPEIPRTFRAWAWTYNGEMIRGSYGFNQWLFGFMFDPSIHTGKHTPDIFSLSGRANIPTLLDATRPVSRPYDLFGPRSLEAWGSFWGPFCINRHNGHVNSLFLDWSVRKVGLKELWTLKWCSEFDTAGPWTKAGGVQPKDWPRWMRKFKDY